VVLSKGHEVVGLGYSRLTGAAAKVMDRGENRVTLVRLTGLARWSSTTQAGLTELARRSITTQARLTRLARWSSITRVGLVGLVGLTKTAAQINEQVRLAGLATHSRK
jgi:hypothetical protein